MTLNAKIEGFVDFLTISDCDTTLQRSLGGATQLTRYAIQMAGYRLTICEQELL